MLLIDLPPEAVKRARQFAEECYDLHYERMYHDKKNRIDKVYIGKLGEEAISIFLGTDPSYDIGTDPGFDLKYKGAKIAVKTKRASRLTLLNLREWWIHIPCDQYPKLKLNSDYLFGCLVKEVVASVKAWIVGWLWMEGVEEVKEFHRAGQQLTPIFKLPSPDSYGIKMAYFMPPLSFPLLKTLLRNACGQRF